VSAGTYGCPGCGWSGESGVRSHDGTVCCPTCRTIATFTPNTEEDHPDGVQTTRAMMRDEDAKEMVLHHVTARLMLGPWQSLALVVVDETAKRPEDRVWTATVVTDEHYPDILSGMNSVARTLGAMPKHEHAVLVAERAALEHQVRSWVARAKKAELESAELRRTLSELAKGGIS
jgi:uncharacterized Zn finger protein (UPF0148 family)